jgi:hypothetical protein
VVNETMTGSRFDAARTVADAVLYEGYLLYPYRASATKNQMRWQFGVAVPPSYAAADPSERCRLRAEMIVDPGAEPVLNGRVRFLRVLQRTIDAPGEGPRTWDEGQVHEVDLAPIRLLPMADASRSTAFHVDGVDEQADTASVDGGVLRGADLDGVIDIEARWADGLAPLIAVAVTVANTAEWDAGDARRDDAMAHSMVGLHVVLAIDDGSFVSSIDPPADARPAVDACTNDGLFPVLLGDEGCADVILASPIILYDHPAVAPESQGDMFDATEIDEILALRVLTLTDEEKAEARQTDARAAAIIDRCDEMPPELWSRLHGAIRTLRPGATSTPVEETMPWWEPAVDERFDPFTDTLMVGGVVVGAGSSVRLHPTRRADAHDMFLVGMKATVGGIFSDVDGDVLVAVTLDDDPATEELAWQGRYLFFHPDEIEVEP